MKLAEKAAGHTRAAGYSLSKMRKNSLPAGVSLLLASQVL